MNIATATTPTVYVYRTNQWIFEPHADKWRSGLAVKRWTCDH